MVRKLKQKELTTIIEAITALLVDGSEAVALADASRSISRVPPGCDVMVDFLILALAIGSVFQILVSDWGLGDDPDPPVNGYPWVDSDGVALLYMAAIASVLPPAIKLLC